MIIDSQQAFADGQVLTSTAVSTNIIDLGVARNIGAGEPMPRTNHRTKQTIISFGLKNNWPPPIKTAANFRITNYLSNSIFLTSRKFSALI